MRKRNLLRLLLLNSLLLSAVPGPLHAAFDPPEPSPLTFALANLASFPDEMILPSVQSARLRLSVGGARLYGLPEVQPFSMRAGLQAVGGWVHFRGTGLSSGAYREMAAALAYERALPKSLEAELEVQVMQVAIEDYGDAWSQQINARLQWSPNPTFALAILGVNLTGSRFGQGDYPLPCRIAVGGKITPYRTLSFFVEMDQDVRYDISPRFGAVFSPFERISLLAALQSEPNIASFGLSGLIGAIRATLAYQYHPDLGFSQCYGLAVAF